MCIYIYIYIHTYIGVRGAHPEPGLEADHERVSGGPQGEALLCGISN